MSPQSIYGQARNVLIVDDDASQARLIELQLGELGLEHRCFRTSCGTEALDFLRRQSPYQNSPRPELILLDINMPGMDGCEVLRVIKQDPELHRIPVIMFSSTSNDQDFTRCYLENANACIRKPRDYEASLEVVREIDRFWFHTAVLPAR